MLKYKTEKYNAFRKPVDSSVLSQLLQETLKNEGITIDTDVAIRVLSYFLAGAAFYLYNNPEFYVDFKKMILYRDTKLNNLFVMEAKGGNNAQSIMDYFISGGAFSEELEALVKSFVQGMLKYSQKKEDEVSKDIDRIKNLTQGENK